MTRVQFWADHISRRAAAGIAASGVIVLFLVAVFSGAVDADQNDKLEAQAQRFEKAEANSAKNRQIATSAKRTARRLAAQVERLGAEPVVDPERLPEVAEADEIAVEIGPVGATGSRGPRGFRGPRGYSGATGTTGPAGKAGEPGLPGVDGGVGPAGPQGPSGPKGEKGDRGETGPPGPQGPQGPPGSPGEIGPMGPAGPSGVGIAALACDSLTPIKLTVTLTDGTTSTVECGGAPPE